ncbi:MAG: beta-L-arabinofuranosidase domain-containing protein [Bacteroidota bacterium]
MKQLLFLIPVFFLPLLFTSCNPAEESEALLYTFNRSPLVRNPYAELPLGSVRAEGWLLEMLERQKDGLTGRLDELYPLVMGDDNGWLGGDGDQWERGPYWIHGLITLAYTLNDRELIEKTTPWIEWILDSQQENGYFGPDTDYGNLPGLQRNNSADWWPRMVVLKILKQYYSATADPRVVSLMSGYFRYQLETLPDKPLDHWTFWARYRGGDNLMMVYWLYNITGEAFLLDLAELIHAQTFDYTGSFLGDMIKNTENIHCVNLAQGIKEPVVYFQQHPEPRYLESVEKAFSDLRHYSGQPQGMFGGDEALRNNNPLNGVEFCSVVELMFSLESILPVTGDTRYADHLERIAFNALPAQATDNFMERQYFQQANQVMITRNDRNFSLNHSGTDLCFGLLTGYPCCTSNMHQGWPLFTQNLWYATPGGGLAALVYAPSKVTALVGQGKEVSITEETGYPFKDLVRFIIHTNDRDEVSFPIDLRIPGWCDTAMVQVNNEEPRAEPGGRIISIDRAWLNGDTLEVYFPADVRLERWYEGSVSVERGPLVFALKIGEDWSKVENSEDPERFGSYYYEVLPTTAWNYGLIDPGGDMEKAFVVRQADKVAAYPWNQESAPVSLQARARQIPGWKLYGEGAGPLPYSIRYGQETGAAETVTLIPYGCTALRISEFPLIGNYSTME